MILQYFVTASDTGNKIPVDIDKSTSADLAATKESWQTDWTSEFIGDPALEKYTAKTESGEIIALGAYRETEASMFVYIEYIESHPESNPTLTANRKYLDIGRMMIAFGIQLSIDSGKNGVVTFEAKTDELAKHYIRDFGAIQVFAKQSGGPIMLMIADNAALSLFNPYLSRDVVRSWILKSNECPLLLLKCLTSSALSVKGSVWTIMRLPKISVIYLIALPCTSTS